jgi:hypothetical protein
VNEISHLREDNAAKESFSKTNRLAVAKELPVFSKVSDHVDGG